VVEIGDTVARVKVVNMVCLPFNISCGFSKNCERGLTGFCLTLNPATAYGYAGMGPYSGGQAEYLRVPYGDVNCLVLPDDAGEKENDYVMLTDIFPAGYESTELAGVKPGETLVVYGAGPVGLMAAYSAFIKGASKIMVVDRLPDRLKLAEKIGPIPIDYSKESPVEQVLKLTGGEGADPGCECAGCQAHDSEGNEEPNPTINQLVRSVKPTGGIGVIGVFVPEDRKASDKLEKKGQIAFDLGLFFSKGLQMGSGQASVKKYNRYLCNLIHEGKAKPSFIVSHQLPLKEAPDAYNTSTRARTGIYPLRPAANTIVQQGDECREHHKRAVYDNQYGPSTKGASCRS